jgi:hypothetical protein
MGCAEVEAAIEAAGEAVPTVPRSDFAPPRAIVVGDRVYGVDPHGVVHAFPATGGPAAWSWERADAILHDGTHVIALRGSDRSVEVTWLDEDGATSTRPAPCKGGSSTR